MNQRTGLGQGLILAAIVAWGLGGPLRAESAGDLPKDLIHQGEEKLKSGDAAGAFQLFQQAASQGDALGEVYVGECYTRGIGVKDDPMKAMTWYQKAADQGNADGEVQMAWSYANGLGVKVNEKEAVKWFRKAADQGDKVSETVLGQCYRTGTGVDKDEVAAAKWYRKAADQGDAEGQVNLGICYEQGVGVDKDLTLAKAWYAKAMDQGNEYAEDALGRLGVVNPLVGTTDDHSFGEQVLKADGPVLVDFFATWCGPCHMYGPVLHKVAKKYKGQVKVVKVDVDQSPQLAQKYKIKEMPTSILFDKGKQVYSWTGYITQEKVEKRLKNKLKLTLKKITPAES